MRFGMAYATRRPQCIAECVNMWTDRAYRPDRVQWCVGVDVGDSETAGEAARLGMDVSGEPGSPSAVRAWNAACHAMMFRDPPDALLAISDDFVPPHRWDVGLEEAILRSGRTDYVVHVHDGGEGTLCTLPVVSAERYRVFGFFYHPGYESMFCDTELTARAFLDGSLIDARHLLFEHMHPCQSKRPKDGVDAEHSSQARWDTGKALFTKRMLAGFPRVGVEVEDLPARTERYCASLQVTRDDICLKSTVHRLLLDGVRNFAFNCPKQHWDGSTVSKSDSDQVIDIAKFLVDHGGHYVRVFQDNLAPFFFPGCSRAQLETNYRNSCLDRLRGLGFGEQLIIDGDEILLPRALAQVDWYVRWFNPTTAALHGVPVAGLPGVAIDGATDRILVYMGSRDKWRDVRSPHHPTMDIARAGVLHLSAVRRSVEEIVAKMRKSGHYDDPEYHFEDWIERVLPALAPGQTNVHMYQDGSLWPRTREFTDDEWQAIPAELQPLMWRKEA